MQSKNKKIVGLLIALLLPFSAFANYSLLLSSENIPYFFNDDPDTDLRIYDTVSGDEVSAVCNYLWLYSVNAYKILDETTDNCYAGTGSATPLQDGTYSFLETVGVNGNDCALLNYSDCKASSFFNSEYLFSVGGGGFSVISASLASDLIAGVASATKTSGGTIFVIVAAIIGIELAFVVLTFVMRLFNMGTVGDKRRKR